MHLLHVQLSGVDNLLQMQLSGFDAGLSEAYSTSLPGLTRQSILQRAMDPRVKPAGDQISSSPKSL
jgi:hypothetical protein